MRTVLMAMIALVLIAGCGDDPKGMTYAQYQALSADAREEVNDDLDNEEVAAMNAGIAHYQTQPGSTPIEQMTLEQLIDKGEEIADAID